MVSHGDMSTNTIKAEIREGIVAPQVQLLLWSAWLEFLQPALMSQPPANVPGRQESPNLGTLATHRSNSGGVPISWLQSGQVLAIVGI